MHRNCSKRACLSNAYCEVVKTQYNQTVVNDPFELVNEKTMSHSRKIADIEFARVGQRSLLLDLDLPQNQPKPLPVIVWLYGGAWEGGSKEERQSPRVVDDALLERGYAIASISYRYSHEALFPAQIQDCKAAIRWLRAHADEYGLDADHIGAWGYSAGAHLAALLGTTGDHPEFDVGDNLNYSSQVQAAATFAAPTDLGTMGGYHDKPDSPESRLIGAPVPENPALVAYASPLTYVSNSSAPFLLIHGDQDTIVIPSQSKLLYDALLAAGVEATLYVIAGCDHSMGALSKAETDKVVATAGAFFDKHLR
jgi:acetyl esterase/lipase